jgi:hypothetical protein
MVSFQPFRKEKCMDYYIGLLQIIQVIEHQCIFETVTRNNFKNSTKRIQSLHNIHFNVSAASGAESNEK